MQQIEERRRGRRLELLIVGFNLIEIKALLFTNCVNSSSMDKLEYESLIFLRNRLFHDQIVYFQDTYLRNSGDRCFLAGVDPLKISLP